MTTDALAAAAHALLERVIDLEPTARSAVLDERCAGRPDLRARVEDLLLRDATHHPLLDSGPPAILALLDDEEAAPPAAIGPYRIVRELGRGGMGVVYLAERSDPDLRVALKVIPSGLAGERMIERFRRERQILANLRHASIARLLDGGVTADGLPFLAMEYVEGQRIDDWCDARRLSVDARLRLFLTVCDAVHYAQRNLVVHRDLKPANIFVTADGEVKLLDFGIAKLLSEEAPAAGADHTLTLAQAFTPRYAAPEQISRAGIGTATDVHALGVILYELLTGASPFPDATSSFEAARTILEVDPRAPSQAVLADSASTERAALRSTTAERLRRRLRGDLDAIVLKALRKDPAERYASASTLADDLRRHLDHSPVMARPDGARYRMRKFVRRRRGIVAAVIALMLLTGAFGGMHTTRIARERDRAELNAAKAEETRDFLLSLFTGNLPSESLGDTLSVADMLERGVARADSLTDRPELRAAMLATLGDVYRALGRFDRAQPLIARSIDDYRSLASDSIGLADALGSLALLRFNRREYDAALAPAAEALAIQRRLLGEDDERTLSSLANMATLSARAGDVDGALRMNEELLARRRRLLGPDDPSIAYTLNNIAFIHYQQDRLPEAEAHFREALELRRRILPPRHPDVAVSLSNLGSVLAALDDLPAAEALFREALALRIDVLGPAHPNVAVTHYTLARVLRRRGRLGEAEEHLRATLAIDRQAYGATHSEVATDALELAAVLAEKGDCTAARPLFEEARRISALHADTAALAEATEAGLACEAALPQPRDRLP